MFRVFYYEIHFNVWLRNYDYLLQFQFWQNLRSFWRKFLFTWNHGCVKFGTFRRSAPGVLLGVEKLRDRTSNLGPWATYCPSIVRNAMRETRAWQGSSTPREVSEWWPLCSLQWTPSLFTTRSWGEQEGERCRGITTFLLHLNKKKIYPLSTRQTSRPDCLCSSLKSPARAWMQEPRLAEPDSASSL